ncbi:MAG: hypothetical protein A2X94_12670 [Bdellovibrionales bacterium GWB1_55_8]|nr:MAG: hypothetical protein A2X94_12670 [Bdellovibrionales bacterium GWB1_55_8]
MGSVLSFCLLGALSAGCGSDPDSFRRATETASDVAGIPGVHLEYRDGSAEARVIADARPNEYKVVLRWLWERPLDGFFVITRFEADKPESKQIVATLSSNVFETSDPSHVEPGHTYFYQVEARDIHGNREAVGSPRAEIPLDFVISGTIDGRTLRHHTSDETRNIRIAGYHRIFFESGAVLRHFDYDLVLQSNEIISDGAQIESFPETSKADLNQNGKNAGHVQVLAKFGSGSLEIVSRGQAGGDGPRGSDGATGAQGPRGADAETYLSGGCARFHADWPSNLGESCSTRCSANATSGGQGIQGGAAGSGHPGKKGGDTGVVHVQITDASELKLEPKIIPGTGGKGGDPGTPGAGGPGGLPGDSRGKCGSPTSGPAGLTGVTADPGAPGPNGTFSPVCVELGPHRKDCK